MPKRGPNLSSGHPRSDTLLVQRAAADAFTRLEQAHSSLLDLVVLNIDDLEVSDEVKRLIETCDRCADSFWDLWEHRKRNRQTRQEVAGTRIIALTHTIPVPPKRITHHPILPLVRPDVRATIRLVIPSDLTGKSWVTDMARECHVGTSLWKVTGDTFRQVLLIRVWGSAFNVRSIATWAQSQSVTSSWEKEASAA